MARHSDDSPRPPIRSPDFSSIHGAVLTERRIDHYIRLGRYGEAARLALLQSKKTTRPRQSHNTLTHVLKTLNSL